MDSNNFQLADTLGFKYIRDHEFKKPDKDKEKEDPLCEEQDLKKEMKKDYDDVLKEYKWNTRNGKDDEDKMLWNDIFMDKLIEDDGEKLKIIATNKGFGLAAGQRFKWLECITTYIGEITKQGFHGDDTDYAMDIRGTRWCADSKYKGNLSRYINHSCDPNCYFETRWFKGKCYPVLIAGRDITKGEELTYDYQYEIVDGSKNFFCLCFEKKCKGLFAKMSADSLICGLTYNVVKGYLELTNVPCLKSFGDSTRVNDHRFSVHYAGNHMQCKLCPGKPKEKKIFTTMNALSVHCFREHKKERTEGNPSNVYDIKIPCKYCKKWAALSPLKWQEHLQLCDYSHGKFCKPEDAWKEIPPRVIETKEKEKTKAKAKRPKTKDSNVDKGAEEEEEKAEEIESDDMGTKGAEEEDEEEEEKAKEIESDDMGTKGAEEEDEEEEEKGNEKESELKDDSGAEEEEEEEYNDKEVSEKEEGDATMDVEDDKDESLTIDNDDDDDTDLDYEDADEEENDDKDKKTLPEEVSDTAEQEGQYEEMEVDEEAGNEEMTVVNANRSNKKIYFPFNPRSY